MAAHFSNTGSQDYLERLSKRCLVFTSPYNSTFPLSLCKKIARMLVPKMVKNGFNSPFRLEKSGVYDENNHRFEAKNCHKTPEEK
jgi:hypothetical protein